MLRAVLFISHLLRAVRYRVTTAVGKLLLRGVGATYGEKLILKGLPVVHCAPGSSIVIGSNVIMISYTSDTALGVNHAVRIETLSLLGPDCNRR